MKKFFFHSPNSLAKFRSETVLTKEPDTIKWIGTYRRNGDLLDIGANVGVYSIFFCQNKKG